MDNDGFLFGRTVKRVALRALGADQLVEGFGFKSCLFVRVTGSEGSTQKPQPVKPVRNVQQVDSQQPAPTMPVMVGGV